ncbi:electron transfer flavoprotein beta subunit lysine methyltransferase [Biomphalaria glabrata]|nr:electron transfer flavoprotein beta subunit lysine methyltransferase [Biomphalaria glabrata]
MRALALNRTFVRQLIWSHTKLTTTELVPEVSLRLITPECPLWKATPEQCPFNDPYWAFFWPGGQVLSRYILDNPHLFYKKSVLDVGSGCGGSSLACKLAGASYVVANDIDQVAEVALEINMEANSLHINTDISNRLSSHLKEPFDFVLLGDMFYDPEFTETVIYWIQQQTNNSSVLIGDPGRHALLNHPIKTKLHQVAEYALPKTCQLENNGLSLGKVWLLDRINMT